MLEAAVSATVALITGLGVLLSKTNSRITELDRRLDSTELRLAETYLSKTEFSTALNRVEAHMVRIEQKLDNLVSK